MRAFDIARSTRRAHEILRFFCEHVDSPLTIRFVDEDVDLLLVAGDDRLDARIGERTFRVLRDGGIGVAAECDEIFDAAIPLVAPSVSEGPGRVGDTMPMT